MVVFEHSGPNICKKTIGILERELGFSLPEDLVKFFIDHNGGIPQPDRVRLQNGKSFEVTNFLTISQDPLAEFRSRDPHVYSSGLISFIKIEYGNKYDEIEYVPIGHTLIGDMLYYSLAEEDFGNIVVRGFDEHEPHEPYKAFIMESLDKLLNSFF